MEPWSPLVAWGRYNILLLPSQTWLSKFSMTQTRTARSPGASCAPPGGPLNEQGLAGTGARKPGPGDKGSRV